MNNFAHKNKRESINLNKVFAFGKIRINLFVFASWKLWDSETKKKQEPYVIIIDLRRK